VQPGLSPGREPEREHALEVMRLALRAGEVMAANAESVSECKQGMTRILRAFGLAGCTVDVEIATITLSWIPRYGEPITMVRAADVDDPHLHRLVRVEKIIGRIEAGEMDLARATVAIERASQAPDPYPSWVVAIAGLVSVAGWVVFSGGGPQSVAVGVASSAAVLPLIALVRRLRVPDVFVVTAGAAGVVFLPYVAVWVGLEFAVGPAVVGGLYQFLPGRALVASVGDGLSGAPVSALARGLQAVVVAVGVALGVLGALALADALAIVLPPVAPLRWGVVVTALAAGAAVGSLAIARQVPWRSVLPVVALGMVVWIVAKEVGEELGWQREASVAVAGLLLGLGGLLMARIQRTVAVLYTGVAVLVLVPGTLLYSSMLQFALGFNQQGAELLLQSVAIAVAIAAGTTLGLALGRAIPGLARTVLTAAPGGRGTPPPS